MIINCISDFPDNPEMNTAPGPFSIKANADGNLENQLGTELGPGQISAFIGAQPVGDNNRLGKQMRMNRGNWRIGVFVCSNPTLGTSATNRTPFTSLAPLKKGSIEREIIIRMIEISNFAVREIFHRARCEL